MNQLQQNRPDLRNTRELRFKRFTPQASDRLEEGQYFVISDPNVLPYVLRQTQAGFEAVARVACPNSTELLPINPADNGDDLANLGMRVNYDISDMLIARNFEQTLDPVNHQPQRTHPPRAAHFSDIRCKIVDLQTYDEFNADDDHYVLINSGIRHYIIRKIENGFEAIARIESLDLVEPLPINPLEHEEEISKLGLGVNYEISNLLARRYTTTKSGRAT